MALYKRGNVWWMNFWFNGQHVQKSTKCRNKRDAATVEAAYQTQLAKGEVGIQPKKKSPSFGTAVKDYLTYLKASKEIKAATLYRYEANARVCLQYFGDVQLDRITPEHIEKFKLWRTTLTSKRTGRQLEPATINHDLVFLKMLFKKAVETEVLMKNPCVKTKCIPLANDVMRVLSTDEQRLYFLACPQPLKDIATIILETGARPSEVLRLTKGDVNLTGGYLVIREGKTKSARRRIPLSDRAKAVLEARMNSASEILFPEQNITSLQYRHLKAVSRAQIAPCRIYDLRHTFATQHAENGTDPATLAALLGHRDLRMIMRYVHPSEMHKTQAVANLEKKQAKAVAH